MPIMRRVRLHSAGPALWPSKLSNAAVDQLEQETPPTIWAGTHQGIPTSPAGAIFLRSWWANANRYDPTEGRPARMAVGRWISLDTGTSDKETNAFTAGVVGELAPDYRLWIRHVERAHLTTPELLPATERLIEQANYDGKLQAVIIEDKSSGIGLAQTLKLVASPEIAAMIAPWQPKVSKEMRWQQASVWCRNNMVLFPHPHALVPWLYDFEDELYSVPSASFLDQADAFSQLILYLENMLSAGYRARMAIEPEY